MKGNIYPVPDPAFPFLGVHFTPRMDGSVWLGPNAVLAFAREGYRSGTIIPRELWQTLDVSGLRQARAAVLEHRGRRNVSRPRAQRVRAERCSATFPSCDPHDCLPGPSGVRAQAMARRRSLVDDFVFEGGDGVLHVRNAPSPAANVVARDREDTSSTTRRARSTL